MERNQRQDPNFAPLERIRAALVMKEERGYASRSMAGLAGSAGACEGADGLLREAYPRSDGRDGDAGGPTW